MLDITLYTSELNHSPAIEAVKTQTVANNRMAIFANQHDHVVLELPPQSRAILVAGKPLGEPIVQYGPFVMNTKDEVMQAVHDYQRGVLA